MKRGSWVISNLARITGLESLLYSLDEFEPFQEVVLVRLVLILGDTVKLGQDVVKRHLVKVKIMLMTMMSDIMRHDDDVSGNDDDGSGDDNEIFVNLRNDILVKFILE